MSTDLSRAAKMLSTLSLKSDTAASQLSECASIIRTEMGTEPGRDTKASLRADWKNMATIVRGLRATAQAKMYKKKLTQEDQRCIGQFASILQKIVDDRTVIPPAPALASKKQTLTGLSSLASLATRTVEEPTPATRVVASGTISEKEHLSNMEGQIKQLRLLQEEQGKLPKRPNKDTKFAFARAPLLITTKNAISDSNMNRAFGKNWFRLHGALNYKTRVGTNTWTYVLTKQLVIGILPDADLKDATRRTASPIARKGGAIDLTSPAIKGATKTQLGTRSAAIRAVEDRLGDMADMLNESTPNYIRNPGNPLVWIWLIPASAHSKLGTVKIHSINFPWVASISVDQHNRSIEQDRKELDELLKLRATVTKHGGDLSPKDEARLAELEEHLSTNKTIDPEAKAYRLKVLRERADQEYNHTFAADMRKVAALQAELKEPGYNTKDKAEMKAEIKLLETKMAQGRAALWKKYAAHQGPL